MVRELVPGTGLGALPWIALVTVSTALFLFWGGPLWSAPREASHVARFVGSYASVLPLAAALLLSLRRFTWERLVTTTGSVWAVKLLVTAVLYQGLARGTATRLVATAPPTHKAAPRAEYHAAPPGFEGGRLVGKVAFGADARAVVLVEAPAAGAAAPAPVAVPLVIRDGRYAESLVLARVGDTLDIENRDATLHTVHVASGPRELLNRPLPPGGSVEHFSVDETGTFHISCDLHPAERGTLVVVDHPYATRTASDGSFALDAVPSGPARVVVLGEGGRAVRATVPVARGRATRIDVGLDAIVTLPEHPEDAAP
ncbi:MAG TPA: carboxypeptidase regulatory-like domain-containing protein [Minicystis sp.]|nr:carboxypeptidase regulatory-like domain-containing protein [Minicystis sp.]